MNPELNVPHDPPRENRGRTERSNSSARGQQIVLGSAIFVVAAIFCALSYQNSVVLTSVAIRLREGVKEHFDPAIPGIAKEHQLPDYHLKLHVHHRLFSVDLGTRLDTSATNWIEFPVRDVVPFRLVQEVFVLEDDKLANDFLERLPVISEELEGAKFRCRLTVAHSFNAGLRWFFDTPVGKALFAGIIVLVVVLGISTLKPFLR